MVRLQRELTAHWALNRHRGRGPLAVFLPSAGRTGAALLRIYNIVDRCHAHGWRAFAISPKLSLAARSRLIAAARPDVLVMQGARHPLNRPWLYPDQPILFDMDDADFHLPHLEAPLRRAMPHVAAVVAGSEYIARWSRVMGAAQTHTLLTGMPVSSGPRVPQTQRAPIVAWAQTRPMTYHREAAFVLKVMAGLVRRCPDVRLRLYDRLPEDDLAFLTPFKAAGITVDWRPRLPFARYLTSFDDVALGLAPLSLTTPFSRGKSVGKVLAYMDRHVPIIASEAGEHRRVIQPGAGILSNDPDVWIAEAAALLADPGRRQTMAERAFERFQSTLSDDAVARRMVRIFNGQVSEQHPPGDGGGCRVH